MCCQVLFLLCCSLRGCNSPAKVFTDVFLLVPGKSDRASRIVKLTSPPWSAGVLTMPVSIYVVCMHVDVNRVSMCVC